MNPKVSAIVAAYNTEAYIAQAIESLLRQTEHNLEVIVVDDASTDATAEVARGFLDKRLKVLVNNQNLGVSASRNRGLREAKGKWLAILDSDDWYAPERLEKLLQVASVEDADMVADDLYFIRDGEQSPWSTLLTQSGEQINKIRLIDPVYFVETDIYGQQGLHLGITKPLFKREFLVQHGIEYDETIRVSEDFWLDVKCLINGARFVLVPEPYYFYRSRSGSLLTQSKVERFNTECRAILNFIQQQEVLEKYPELVRALSKNLATLEKQRGYYTIVEPLKRKDLLAALIAMARHPYFLMYFLMQLPEILERRWQYYVLGNKLVYETMYQKDKK